MALQSVVLALITSTLCATVAIAAPGERPRERRHGGSTSSRDSGGRAGTGESSRSSAPASEGVPTIPDDGRACQTDSPRYKGLKVTIRDHRGQPLRCKIALAKHNLEVAKSSRNRDNGIGWETTLRKLEVEQAMVELQAAAGDARAAAEAKLNKAIDAADKMDEKLAARGKKLVDDARAQAEARVKELKTQLDAASGKAKQELNAKYLKAQQAAKKLEQKLAALDVDAAQAKLDNAMKRVGAEADAVKQKARAQVDAAKKKFDDARKKLDAAIADLQKQLDKLEQQLKGVVEDAEKAVQEVEDSLDELTDGLDDLL